MARAYSQDLRDRVLDAALAGLPAGKPRSGSGLGSPPPSSGCAGRGRLEAQAAPARAAAALQARSTIQRKPDFAVCCGNRYRRRF